MSLIVEKAEPPGREVANMQKALEQSGIRSEGVLLNRKDFQSIAVPSVWLMGDHYVVVCQVTESHAVVYDPMLKSQKRVALPPIDNDQFSAVVLRIVSSQVNP